MERTAHACSGTSPTAPTAGGSSRSSRRLQTSCSCSHRRRSRPPASSCACSMRFSRLSRSGESPCAGSRSSARSRRRPPLRRERCRRLPRRPAPGRSLPRDARAGARAVLRGSALPRRGRQAGRRPLHLPRLSLLACRHGRALLPRLGQVGRADHLERREGSAHLLPALRRRVGRRAADRPGRPGGRSPHRKRRTFASHCRRGPIPPTRAGGRSFI